MRPGVHLSPDRLRAHSAAAAELSGSLHAALARRPPAARDTELDDALRRGARELAELGAVLASVASAAETADGDAARSLRDVGPP